MSAIIFLLGVLAISIRRGVDGVDVTATDAFLLALAVAASNAWDWLERTEQKPRRRNR